MIVSTLLLALLPSQDTPTLPPGVAAEISAESVKAHVERLVLFGTRHTFSDASSDERGIGAARRWIRAELERYGADGGGRLEVSLQAHERPAAGGAVEVVNVVGVLPGTMAAARGRTYVVLGHYDSRAGGRMDAQADAPGANDDASGVAVVLELARVLADAELDSTVVFLATAGEEQGLWGATHFVERALAEGVDLRAALSNDIVGDPTGPPTRAGEPRLARDRVRVFSEGVPSKDAGRFASSEGDAPSRQLARFVAEVAELHGMEVRPMLVHRADRFMRGGDHTPFNRAGVAAVRFTEVYENYAHQHQDVRLVDGLQHGDLPEFVDGPYLAGVARLNAAALIHLANAPSVPANARILLGGLSNDTRLRWDASPEPDVAGYEVVWRATTSPEWTDALDVGDVTAATLELSVDNWFFGVRAYDREGYRSPVAFPGVARE